MIPSRNSDSSEQQADLEEYQNTSTQPKSRDKTVKKWEFKFLDSRPMTSNEGDILKRDELEIIEQYR